MLSCLIGTMSTPMPETRVHTSSFVEIAIVSFLCFGLFIVTSLGAVASGSSQQKHFADASLLSLVLIEAVLAALTLGFLTLRKYPIGRLRPTPGHLDTAIGIGLFASGYVATVLAYLLVAPGNDVGSQPITRMLAEGHRSFLVVLVVSTVNGLYEETFLLGYLMDALRAQGASIAIGLTCLARLLYHLYQGPVGAFSVTVWGVVIGLFYWRTKRLWPAILAHQLTDLVGLAS